MTILELHREFKFELDKIDTQALPRFTPEEVDSILNRAVLRFIKTRYNFNNLYKKAFEQTQKRIDDLRTLVHYTTPVFTNEEVTLPSDYMILLRLEVKLLDNCGELTGLGKQVETDDLNKLLDDPFNKPKKTRYLYVFRDNKIVLFIDPSTTVTDVKMTYLRMPVAISFANKALPYTELPEHVHGELVTMAANIALENIESPRVQTHQQEFNRIE